MEVLEDPNSKLSATKPDLWSEPKVFTLIKEVRGLLFAIISFNKPNNILVPIYGVNKLEIKIKWWKSIYWFAIETAESQKLE